MMNREAIVRVVRKVGASLHEADLRLLLGLLLVALGAWAFFAIADEITERGAHAIDERIVRAFRVTGEPEEFRGPPWMVTLLRDVTALGSVAVIALAVTLVGGYLVIRGNYRALVLVLAAVLGALLFSQTAKAIVGRARPVLPALADERLWSASFPSGHATVSAAVYLTLGALLARLLHDRSERIYALAVALLLSLLVGLSRVVLGVHYASDVLAGWCLGLTWAALCWLAAAFLRHLGAVHELGDRRSPEPARSTS